MGLDFGVAISSKTKVWRPEAVLNNQNDTSKNRKWRRLSSLRDVNGSKPVFISTLAQELFETEAFKAVTWREGTRGKLTRHFTAVRVQSAESAHRRMPPSEKLWLLLEQDTSCKGGFKYYFLSLPENTNMKILVGTIKQR